MKKVKIITVVSLMVVMLAAMTGLAAAETYEFDGIVVDENGNPLEGITVQFYDSRTNELLAENTTSSPWDVWYDKAGEYLVCVYLEFPDGTLFGIGELGEDKTCWIMPAEYDALVEAVSRIETNYGGGNPDEIPEFSTVAIPAASILGLLFFFNYRKRRRR